MQDGGERIRDVGGVLELLDSKKPQGQLFNAPPVLSTAISAASRSLFSRSKASTRAVSLSRLWEEEEEVWLEALLEIVRGGCACCFVIEWL